MNNKSRLELENPKGATSMKNNDWNIGTGDLCAFFGISDETSRTWVKSGCPKTGHGQWNLKTVFD
jgi:hypothetical protein